MTYSIVARDKKTGEMWVAVQTHWFWVGNNVPWLEAGVGAIATQAQTEMKYGKRWIELLKQWKLPEEVIKEIWKDDEGFDFRQVAIIDNKWNISTHTWNSCVKYADYIIGDWFIVQGNLLTNEDVLPAMKQAYEDNINTDFTERLYLSIKAGEEAWGELRWVQSAALRIVSGTKGEYDIVNLRIDDHEAPLNEIHRQINLQKAYNFLNEAELQGEIWSIKKSLELFSRAQNILPKSKEVLFWKAFMLKNRGMLEEAQEILDRYFQWEEMWLELWERIEG